jgi:hypothetical protein
VVVDISGGVGLVWVGNFNRIGGIKMVNDRACTIDGMEIDVDAEIKDASLFLKSWQLYGKDHLDNGKILVGSVGAGKSRTAIAWWYELNGGVVGKKGIMKEMDPSIKNLYIITTADKRNQMDWEYELMPFGIWSPDLGSLSPKKKSVLKRRIDIAENLPFSEQIVVDSWNNIQKYAKIRNQVFIFDEDHLTGKGVWVKSFYEIAKNNIWVVLTATPGDSWMDYYPVFKANGFFKTKREFEEGHVVYNPHVKWPAVIRYTGVGKLEMYRRKIIVQIPYEHKIDIHDISVMCKYDLDMYRNVSRYYMNPWSDDPIENASGMCYVLRRVSNDNVSRLEALDGILKMHPKVIIFYNFDYELAMLRRFLDEKSIIYAEKNGHKHESVPDTANSWVYLVNYGSGAEAWNCITTNVIVFFSQTYSYKTLVQAKGRVNRMNTPFLELYYYHLRCSSPIDRAIYMCLKGKKDFNESKFFGNRRTQY